MVDRAGHGLPCSLDRMISIGNGTGLASPPLKRDDFSLNRLPVLSPLFEHDLFRKTGIHFSGSCFSAEIRKDIHADDTATGLAVPDVARLQCLHDLRLVRPSEVQNQLAA